MNARTSKIPKNSIRLKLSKKCIPVPFHTTLREDSPA